MATTVLRGLTEQQILPGARLRVIDVTPDGSVRLRIGRADQQVPFDQARAVYVALEGATTHASSLLTGWE